MISRSKPLLSRALGVGLLLALPQAPVSAQTPQDGCEAAKALTLIDKAVPADAEITKLTGARKIRRVAPGDAATLDYQPDRITLEIENGRVTATRCG